LLSDDAAAALNEARRLAGARTGRIGFQGGSQGGWVAPLASTKTHTDFVVVSFGLAVSPIEEDRQEVALEMALKGHSPEEIKKAEEVAYAAEEIASSGLTRGFERFDALRARYRNEPWYKDLHGDFTWILLPMSKKELLAHKSELVMGTPWNYDAMAVLHKVTTPELWILGGNDLESPSAETSHRILSLADQGKPFTLAMFPSAEHGIYEYEMDEKGERVDLRNPAGYFPLWRDFVRDGKLSGPYGDAAIVAKGETAKIR
jgi:dienelactone hydrolase